MCVSESFFFALQKEVLHKIIWMVWCCEQVKDSGVISMYKNIFQIEAIQELKDLKDQGTPTILAGDGKYDSPGVAFSFEAFLTKLILFQGTAPLSVHTPCKAYQLTRSFHYGLLISLW